MIASVVTQNCEFVKDDIWVETNKPVMAGQELTSAVAWIHFQKVLLSTKNPVSQWMFFELPQGLQLLSEPYEDEDLFVSLHMCCGFPRDFLAKRDNRRILEVLKKKVKGRDGHYHHWLKERLRIYDESVENTSKF